MTPAQAKAQREKTLHEIRAELKKADRARLSKLRDRVRAMARERRDQIRAAQRACSRKASGVPTVKEALAMLRAARAEAKSVCALEKKKAHAIKDKVKAARAEREAEAKEQRTLRRLERHHKERARERPGVSKAERRAESDEEVRGNIPPSLVPLFDRVKRQIHGTARMSRTEAFLQYAHEHPDEEIAAIESDVDRMIAAHERGERTARANPRRPPRAWWEACIESVQRRGGAANVSAVCGAAWWNMPAHRRMAIVRSLERAKDRRARGAALALARAEKARHAGRAVPRLRSPNPRELVSLVYLEQKPGDPEPFEYEHEFAGDLPSLRMRGGALQIEGGSYRTKNGWIEG